MIENRKIRIVGSSFILVVLLLAFSCATPLQWGSIPTDIADASLDQWLADFDAFGQGLSRHPKLASGTEARADFDRNLAAAKTDLASFAAAEGVASGQDLADEAFRSLRALLSSVEDGHTRFNASPSTIFPVALRSFPSEELSPAESLQTWDGWKLAVAAVDASDAPNADLVDAGVGRDVPTVVTKVGGVPVSEAIGRLDPLLSVESVFRSGGAAEALLPHALRQELIDAFMNPLLLRSVGLADGDTLMLTLSRADMPDGEFERSFAEGPWPSSWLRVLDGVDAPSFVRSHPGEAWWFERVPEEILPSGGVDAIYFRYDDCDRGAYPIINDLLDALPDADSGADGPARLIIDLRFNSGGDSRPGSYLARSLAGKEVSRHHGGVVVLAGGATFSSAMMNAADILKACGARGSAPGNAILVGEPIAEPMRHYGEVGRFSLPGSGLIVGYSKRLWRYDRTTGIYPARGILEPGADNLAVSTFSDYSGGRDPAFDRALSGDL